MLLNKKILKSKL